MKYSWSCSFCVSPGPQHLLLIEVARNLPGRTSSSTAKAEAPQLGKAAPQLVRKSLSFLFSLSLSWVTLLYEYFCIRRLFTPSSGKKKKGGIFATT